MGASESFDPKEFAMTEEDWNKLFANPRGRRPREDSSQALPRHRPGKKFLRGPIPWDWLDRAGGLPGQALQVALVLWRAAGLKGRATVKLSLSGELPLGLNEYSARRGVRRLEGAGLVSIKCRPGHSLEVTILAVPESGAEGNGVSPEPGAHK